MNQSADPGDPTPEQEPGSDLVDLGETRLPTRLDVAPTSVGEGRPRRLDARVAVVVAIAIVAVAALGTGPLAPRPRPTTSPIPTTSPDVGAASPEPTDPCPVVTPQPPLVFVGAINQFTVRAVAAGTGVNFKDLEVVVPVAQTLELQAGVRMRTSVSDNRCVDLVGIDVIDTSRPTGNPLTIRVPAPFATAARSATWEAPPAGDWVVRIALRLRERALAGTGSWFVYFFRLNSGYVPWASPVPDGVIKGPDDGPFVTPAVPCGPIPTDGSLPPAVDLVLGGTSVPGILGSYHWRGTAVEKNPIAEVVTAEQIELTGPYSVELAGGVCATSWGIGAGLLGATDPPFVELTTLDSSPDNPKNDPAVAAQNKFLVMAQVLGEYVIEGRFTFQNGDTEVRYWRVRVAVPSVAEGHLLGAPAGSPVAMTVGCGRAIQQPDGTYGSELCATSWIEPPAMPTISVPAGGTLRADVGGLGIVSWNVEYLEPAHIAEGSCQLTSGYSAIGLQGVDIPAPAPGTWSVRVTLSYRDARGDIYTAPYFVRFEVAPEDASPGPTPSPCPPQGVVD